MDTNTLQPEEALADALAAVEAEIVQRLTAVEPLTPDEIRRVAGGMMMRCDMEPLRA